MLATSRGVFTSSNGPTVVESSTGILQVWTIMDGENLRHHPSISRPRTGLLRCKSSMERLDLRANNSVASPIPSSMSSWSLVRRLYLHPGPSSHTTSRNTGAGVLRDWSRVDGSIVRGRADVAAVAGCGILRVWSVLERSHVRDGAYADAVG